MDGIGTKFKKVSARIIFLNYNKITEIGILGY